jgi:methionyl-tRNA formyltransferase
MRIAFLGGSEFSVYVLDELKAHGILPEILITTPDKPKGRRLVLTPTPVKIWAQKNNIEVIEPYSLKKDNADLISKLRAKNYELFLVASYGKLIPKEIFDIPEKKTLNIHPSLLPKYRGASPIQSQILEDAKEVGVTIMQIDEGMDTGPIVIQKKITIKDWPIGRKELEKILAIEGARLFAHILPEWMKGAIDPIMQKEAEATYCKKIEKKYGEIQIDLNNLPTDSNARQCLLKIKAFEEWPTAYFFLGTPKHSEDDSGRKRIIITDATIKDDVLKILKVIPEGKKEMPFEDFIRGYKSKTQNSS